MAQRRPSRLTSCDACAHPSVHRAMERWIMTRSELLRHLASAADWGATLLSDPLLIMDIPVLGLRQPPINIDNPCGDTIPSTPVGASGSRGTCRSPGMIVQKLVDPSTIQRLWSGFSDASCVALKNAGFSSRRSGGSPCDCRTSSRIPKCDAEPR